MNETLAGLVQQGGSGSIDPVPGVQGHTSRVQASQVDVAGNCDEGQWP